MVVVVKIYIRVDAASGSVNQGGEPIIVMSKLRTFDSILK